MERTRIDLEFLFRASPSILYQFLTTPSCLIRWFCDEVDITGENYEFYWDGYPEIATLVEDIEDEKLRFRWEGADNENEFLEFRLKKSNVTSDTILEITDFCDADEIKEEQQLWKSQIETLRRETGG